MELQDTDCNVGVGTASKKKADSLFHSTDVWWKNIWKAMQIL